MPLARRSNAPYLRLLPPDLIDECGEQVLLVWGEVPYWMVVDHEAYALLRLLDGERTVAEILAGHASWQAAEREIAQLLDTLRQGGVLHDARGPEAKAPETAEVRIENVALNLTRQCNLRCRFCYNLDQLSNNGDGELSAPEIIDFLKQARPLCGRTPSLTTLGGEPLCQPEKLLAVSAAARKLGYTTLVSTNGTLVTDDFARRAKQIGLHVQVSIDGHNAELNDRVRGAGAFARARAGIELLLRRRVHTIVSMVCHRGNIDYLEEFFAFAAALGVREARFIPLKRLGAALGSGMTPAPLAELLHAAFSLFTRRPEFRPLFGSDALSILAATCRFSTRRPSCGTGLQTVLLDADGGLYPCLNTNRAEFRFANLRDPGFDFRQCWQQSPLLRQVRASTAIGGADHPHAHCPVRYWCLAGCRGENHALTGRLDARPPDCRELKRGILAMFWMLAERPELSNRGNRDARFRI